MKVSFYIKLFLAFIIFSILVLGFVSYLFDNFYTFYDDIKKCECCINCGNSVERINV